MKKNILFLLFILIFLACETGIRYDKNVTTKKVPKDISLISQGDIENLINDESNPQTEIDYEDITYFSGGIISDELEVGKIREGHHEEYIRLVFDVYNESGYANSVGHYEAIYNRHKKDISVKLSGYRKFSASFPSFSHSSVIEKIYFEKYLDDSGFKFHIKLRQDAKLKIFDLPNPARLVFDIKAI